MPKPLRPAITFHASGLGVTLSLRGQVPPDPGGPVLVEIDGGGEEPTDDGDEAGAESSLRPALVDRDRERA